MKRVIACLLIAMLLLSGCEAPGERLREPVTFYYLHVNPEGLRHGESLFVGEMREAAGHRYDLSYLMALYIIGPSGEELVSPLPRGTKINEVTIQDGTVQLTLSDTEKTLTDIEFTLACTCLSMTCLELTNAQAVTITSGERSVTMERGSLVLSDRTAATETEETP